MRQEVNIIVDDREVRSGIIDHLRAIDGVSTDVRRLMVGDYEVDGSLLIERKTLLDFAESTKDGRLFRQATRLADAPLTSLMILEGTASHLKTSRMRRESLQGALISLTIKFGIPILRSLDLRETARLITYMARQKDKIAYGVLSRNGKRPKGKLATQLYILQGLPNVGPERARLLLSAFGSIEAIMQANKESLLAVDGIGSTTAKRILWAIQEPSPVYIGDS